MLFLKEQYRKAFAFLRGPLKKPYLICCGIFLALCVLSYAALSMMPETARQVYDFFAQSVEDSGLMNELGEISITDLFMHNVQATGISTLYGLVPFIFLPLLTLVLNGVVIGGVLAVVQAAGQSNVLLTVLLGLLPHGIFELPAVLMGMGLGMVLCLHLSGGILKKSWALPLEALLENLARVYLLLIIPMLAVAALIETYITPLLLQLI